MDQELYIRIDKCRNPWAWYAKKIGHILKVEREEINRHPSQGLKDDVYWCREGGVYNSINIVFQKDATRVPTENYTKFLSATVDHYIANASPEQVEADLKEANFDEYQGIGNSIPLKINLGAVESALKAENEMLATDLAHFTSINESLGDKNCLLQEELEDLLSENEWLKAERKLFKEAKSPTEVQLKELLEENMLLRHQRKQVDLELEQMLAKKKISTDGEYPRPVRQNVDLFELNCRANLIIGQQADEMKNLQIRLDEAYNKLNKYKILQY